MSLLKNLINNILYNIIKYSIVFYQKIISPILPARCRYYPTCSNYGRQALEWHGVRAGIWLLLKRIGRCHPLGGHGVDFVPLPLASYTYYYLPSVAQNSATCLSFISILEHPGVYRDRRSYVALLNHLMK